MTPRKRPLPWIGATLALGLVVWLAQVGFRSGSEVPAPERDASERAPGSLIRGRSGAPAHDTVIATPPSPILEGQKVTRGPLTVEVVDVDGQPVAGAIVDLGDWILTLPTNDRGRVVYPRGVLAGRQSVIVIGAGPSWRTSLDITSASRQTHTVRVPRGAQLDVTVVGSEGRPLPHARIEVETASKLQWYDMDGDTQRLDPFVNALGERHLHNLPPDTSVTIRAHHAGLSCESTVRLAPGSRQDLRLEMFPPEESE